MSEPHQTAPQGDEALPEEAGEALQFDQAEFATPAGDGPACTVCQQPVADEYYELGGKVFCGRCRQGVEAAFRGGSRFARVFKALILGSIAAAVGAVIYYLIVRTIHINSALISILVGFMVGGAVRRGSGNRGGALYQGLAVFLTYSCLVAMHTAFEIGGVIERARQEAKEAGKLVEQPKEDLTKSKAAITEKDAQPKTTEKPGPPRPAAEPVAEQVRSAEPKVAVANGVVKEKPVPVQEPAAPNIWSLVYLIGLLYALPILYSMGQPISGLIYAFALWEAWKINRGLVLAFNGPFRLGKTSPDEISPEVIDDGA